MISTDEKNQKLQAEIPVKSSDIEIETVPTPKPASDPVLGALPTVVTPMSILEIAVQRNDPLEKLKALMDLQERWEKNEAKKAYYQAMAAFKANPPAILKTEQVSFKHKTGGGKTEYMYADLGFIATTIGAALAVHGLFADWETKTQENKISVTCTITHELGYSKSVTFPPTSSDTSGMKNEIQAIQSAITYQQRHTLLSITGLAAKGVDDDGRGGGEVEYITDKELHALKAVIEQIGDAFDMDAFLDYAGVESLEKIPAGERYEYLYKKVVDRSENPPEPKDGAK